MKKDRGFWVAHVAAIEREAIAASTYAKRESVVGGTILLAAQAKGCGKSLRCGKAGRRLCANARG